MMNVSGRVTHGIDSRRSAPPEARYAVPGLPAGSASRDRLHDDHAHERKETTWHEQSCEDEGESAVHADTDVQERCHCEARYAPEPVLRTGR